MQLALSTAPLGRAAPSAREPCSNSIEAITNPLFTRSKARVERELPTEGNLYGTTTIGGAFYGKVFKLDTKGVKTVLYSFADVEN
jgi:uncharacterized repeat protein (TIGR03803 family)